MPSNYHMQLEACRIIFASEASSPIQTVEIPSWVRDLIMSSENIAKQAKFGPLRLRNESRLSTLKIIGKDNPFELCPLEAQLCAFAEFQGVMGNAVSNDRIQEEACNIITCMEKTSTFPSDTFKNFMITLIYTSTGWLSRFQQRIGVPLHGDDGKALAASSSIHAPGANPDMSRHPSSLVSSHPLFYQPASISTSNDFTKDTSAYNPGAVQFSPFVNNANFHDWLVRDLTRWVTATISPNNPHCHIPSDKELQHQARCIMYDE
jgi:hypothetical protein